MKTKKQHLAYRVGVVLTAVWFGLSGWFEITKNPIVWDKTIALGYPGYFIITLGIAKLIGILLLLIPINPAYRWIREWVFAGLLFDIFFALVSGYAVFGPTEALAPLIALIIVLPTYFLFKIKSSTEPKIPWS